MPVRKRPLKVEPSSPKVKVEQSSEQKTAPKDEPRLLTIPKVANHLSTSALSVREMERAGLLKRVPILGKAHKFHVTDVDLLIEATRIHGRKWWTNVGKRVVPIRAEVNSLVALVEKLKAEAQHGRLEAAA